MMVSSGFKTKTVSVLIEQEIMVCVLGGWIVGTNVERVGVFFID
jgi:hypothetical protein